MGRNTRPWWGEPETGLLVLLVACLYFARLTDLPIRGEESRRGLVALQMLQTGDWVVPRLQGELYLSRPPLQNWVIALAGAVRGDVDTLAVRLPSALAILLTTLLVYGYSRTFLSRGGALAAGAAFASMGHVLQLGRLGETEALFTLLVSASLLSWHWTRVRGWPAAWGWVLAYVLAALGAIAKGPQAPVYFVGSAVVYLLVRREWRALLGWSHLAGVAAFAVVLLAWFAPYAAHPEVGFDEAVRIWTSSPSRRFTDAGLIDTLHHVVTYPLEVIGCMMPWAILLGAYLFRDMRRPPGGLPRQVLFLFVCIAVTFPTVWLAGGARGRYFMPLFPCFAPLIGYVVQRCCESFPPRTWRMFWGGYLLVIMIAMAVTAVAVIYAARLDPQQSTFVQPTAFAVSAVALVVIGIALAQWARGGISDARVRAGVLTVAGWMGLTYVGGFLNALLNSSLDVAATVKDVRDSLPSDERLVSFELVDHLFAYHFRDPIEPLPWPATAEDVRDDVTYFCFFEDAARSPLPFDWEQITAVSCERSRHRAPHRTVIVGRRVPQTAETVPP